jgi:4-hydroxybenzoate polyprenyltransferase
MRHRAVVAVTSTTRDLGLGPPSARELLRRRVARRLRDYATLTRLNRPIGIWLLLWPTLWSLWIAARGRPDWRVFVVLVLGTIVMRSAGCVINDFADRDIDPHVKRTRERPLAARRVSPFEALALFLTLIAVALLLVLQLNALTIKLALAGAALTVTYPLLKRFFAAPQFYLGVAFGWGVVMAHAAQAGAVTRVTVALLLCAILWAAIYDTEYAMVDRDDDLRLGVHSTAILFGDMDRTIIGGMQAMMLFGLFVTGRGAGLGVWYSIGLALAAVCFIYQQWLIRDRDRDACFRAFLNNHYVGLVIFIGMALDYALSGR